MSDPHSVTDRLDVLQRSQPAARPRRRGARIAAIVLLVGVLGVAWIALEPLLFPPARVEIAQVEPADPSRGASPRGRVVEAQGWVEAAPWPVSVRPLVEGIVEKLGVVEGDDVEAGVTMIATLRNVAIENEAKLAAAALEVARAAEAEARTALEVATAVRDHLLEPRARLVEVVGRLAAAEAERNVAVEAVRIAEAARDAAKIDLVAQERIATGGGLQPIAHERALAAHAEAEARVRDRVAALERAEVEIRTARAVVEVAREGVADPRALTGEVERARAALAAATAALAEVAVREAVAAGNVEHLSVRAPITGRVLRLEAAPGAVVGPGGEFTDAGEPSASGSLNRMTGTLCALYVPSQLQARIDVPLASVGGIATGTKAEIAVEGLSGPPLRGTVARLVREADLNKNTLQVKVALIDPPDAVRPEMLCRARFDVAPSEETATTTEDAQRRETFWIPADAVLDGTVFLHDPAARRARRVTVEVLETRDGRARVVGGLGRSSKVVRRPTGLKDGARVEVQP